MAGLLILFGLALFVAALIALVKPLPKLWMGSRKAALVGLAASIASCSVGASLAPKPNSEGQPQIASTGANKSSATQSLADASVARETKAKAEALKKEILTLWSAVQVATKRCDTANGRVVEALQASNRFAAYEAADNGHDICRETWSTLNALDPPASAKGETEDKFEKALESCSGAYLFRQMSLDKMRTVLDGDFRPSALQDYKEDAQTAQSGVCCSA